VIFGSFPGLIKMDFPAGFRVILIGFPMGKIRRYCILFVILIIFFLLLIKLIFFLLNFGGIFDGHSEDYCFENRRFSDPLGNGVY
jgi:hypothetical protein